MTQPSVFITNFNKRFTGVSATIANLVPHQAQEYDLRLVGRPLPGCPDPITTRMARRLSRQRPDGRPFAIWHVRRDPEMQAAIWARDVLRLPIKTVFTSAAQRRHSAIPRWLIGRMDAVIATTPEAASFLDRDVAAVAPHGIDTNRLTPAQDRRAAWQALGYGGDMGIATIGRVRPEKGTDVFVDAAIEAMKTNPGLTALVIGLTAPKHRVFENGLRAKINAAGMTRRFHFTGPIDNATDLPAVLRALSLVVNVPRYEGYGVVPLEGLSSGTPFVCSDAGIYRDLSQNGQHGLIAPISDAAQTAALMSELLSDPDRIDQMGQLGRAHVQNTLSVGHEAAIINGVYETLWSQG